MNKHKILVFTKSIEGGTGTFIEGFMHLPQYLKNAEIPYILVLEKPSYRTLSKPQLHHVHFLRDQKYYPSRYGVSPKSIIDFLRELQWLYGHIRDYAPDIVLSTDAHCNLLASIVRHAPLIGSKPFKLIVSSRIHLHQTLYEKASFKAQFLLRKAIRTFYNKADAIVCVSKGIARSLETEFSIRQKPIVIYNGISKKQRVPKERQFPVARPVIISVGRLVEQKDFETLIHAYAKVVRHTPSCQLCIVGDGPKKYTLKKLGKTLNLEHNIEIVGWKNHLHTYFRKSHIFVLSSNREGFGWVLIEAMSYGLPVITTDAPCGPSEVVEDGKYGLLVPVGDVNQMAKNIMKLLSDKKNYLSYSKKSYARVSFFSEEKMLRSYAELFQNLLNA